MTTRGALASERRWEEEALLRQAVESWGRRVLHVFDRGFAGAPWLRELTRRRVRFVLRWPKRYHLIAPTGEELCAWEIARGKRTWELEMVALTYAFLLSLLQPDLERLREDLPRGFCPRTRKRSREASTPLYRLRAAVCFRLLSLRTLPQLQSSGSLMT